MEKPMSTEDFARIEKLMSQRDHSILLTPESKRDVYLRLADEVPALLADVRYWRRRWATDILTFHGPRYIGDACLEPSCVEARAILEEKP